MSGKLIYISGGARSGKSRHAQILAESYGANPVYIATAQAFDQEMTDRISRHQSDRDDRWSTLEEPIDLIGAIAKVDQQSAVILVDCLTLWLTNLMMSGRDITHERTNLCQYLASIKGTLIIVSNEVGMGIIPSNDLSRSFVDEAGFLNQSVAAISHDVYFTVSGIPIKIK